MSNPAFFTEDSRKPIEKLRRHTLHKIADARGIDYPNQAPKDTMIQLLEAHGVDVTQPIEGLNWQVVNPDPTAQKAAAMHGTALQPQLVPVQQAHASIRNGIDAAHVLNERLAKEEEENEKLKELEARNAALQRELQEEREQSGKLRELFESRLAQLEQRTETLQESDEPPPGGMPVELPQRYSDLCKFARDMGIHIKRGMKKTEVRALVEERLGQNAT